jgi:outer membrane protein assembly factor BamB
MTTPPRALCALLLLALPLALWAGKPLDPQTTLLPSYLLPDAAAVDGKLDEWRGIPASATGEQFKPAMKNETITASPNFAPTLRCGMKKGSPDLYFLVVVQDAQLYDEDSAQWMAGDYLELFLDFGRAARDLTSPGWQKEPKQLHTPPGMGQFGFRPRTLQVTPKTLSTAGSANWTAEATSVPVAGGIAYEIRLDSRTILADLKLPALPAYIGLDLGLMDQDYNIRLWTAGWTNDHGVYRLFGDGMDHAFPTKYGMLATRPQPAPAEAPAESLPKTFPALFGMAPTAADVQKAIGKLEPARLADLVTWAGMQGVVLPAATVKALMATGSPEVREKCLAVLNSTSQREDAVRAGAAAVYAPAVSPDESPYVLTLANLLTAQYALNYPVQLRALALHADLTVAFTAIRALAKVGVAEDLAFLEGVVATVAADPARTPIIRAAYKFYCNMARETLAARTAPIVIPAATPIRTVQAANTDLERFIPADGNNVYNGKGLLRRWPASGPKELWRVKVGKGKSDVVEVQGRAFTAAMVDGAQWAICLDPKSGKTLWKTEIAGKAIGATETISSPIVDGDRVYIVPNSKTQEVGESIVCLKAGDGSLLWRGEGDLRFTESSSTPLIVGEVLYLPLYSGKETPFSPLAAVNKLTGAILWKAPPSGRRGSGISSPTYQIIDGLPQIIISVYHTGSNEVWGVNAKTGELFWRYASNAHYGLIPSPVAVDSRVYLCDAIPPFSACLQMYVREGKIQARQLYRDARLQCNLYNTVAIADGAVYGFSGNSLQCTRLEDGKLLWRKEGKLSSGSQLILADGLLFALTPTDLVLAELAPAGCTETGSVKHGLELGYPQQPTLANGRLYIRGEEWVVCYDVLGAQ